VWAVVLLIGIVADNPIFAPAYLRSRLRDLQATSEVRTVLAEIPRDARVLAQPQLVPHIRKRPGIECLAGEWRERQTAADVVVVSTLGNQWPLDGADVNDVIARFEADPRYSRANVGSQLALFVRRAEVQ
jgi:hypothetical protein